MAVVGMVCHIIARAGRVLRPYIISAGVLSTAGLIAALVLMGCGGSVSAFYWAGVLFTIAMLVLVPSLVYLLFYAISRVRCLWHRAPVRWVNRVGSVAAMLVAIMMVIGLFNRKNLIVNYVDMRFDRLPEQFDGLRVVHISDLHLGSFGCDTMFVGSVVDRINSLNPDLILFTGDIVSVRADEMRPFIDRLRGLKASEGVFAVLGNHDYSDYARYDDNADRDCDRELLKQYYDQTAFKLLRDSSVDIVRGEDTINIVGTENIGSGSFAKYGSLYKSCYGLDRGRFKILMTHDPGVWTDSIADGDDYGIDLTLSGHTHAMQCRLLGWSPSSLRDKVWAGEYISADSLRRLYINVGIGTVGPMMRIGATPEITLITLRR